MDVKKIINKKTIIAFVLIIAALVSVFGISKVASSPEFHTKSITSLDNKKVTVASITAATAVSSVAVSMVPGDSTTAIANQIANLSSYLLIVVGAIVLEKILLTLTGYISFTFIIPIACLLGTIHIFYPKKALKSLALKLAAFGLIIFLIVPISIKISDTVEKRFEIQKVASIVEDDTADKENKDKSESNKEGILGWFAKAAETVENAASDALDKTNESLNKAKELLNNFIDSIAVLLITSCVIPILVLFMLVWLVKIVFGLNIPDIQKVKHRSFFNSKDKSAKTEI